jgi:small-conductance mechanosensitive channel
MLPEGSALLRIVLVAEGGLALLAAVAWLRRTSSEPGDRLLGAFRLAVGAGALVLSAALLANVSGYLFLSTALTRGVGYGTYGALALSGGVIVLDAVIDLVIVSPVGDRVRSLADHGELVRARSHQALSAAAGFLFLGLLLDGFGVAGPFHGWVEEVLGQQHRLGTLELSLGEVFSAIAVLAVTYVVLRFVRFHLELDVLPRLSLEPGVDGAISGLTRYVIGGAGLLVALASLGIDAEQIALVAGALGVGIGFGLQGIVANFIAGIVLMLERPVRLGDFVEVGPLVGRVERIGLRSSTVKALDGAEVIVPNESLISREVINWTLSDRKRRVEVKVGVAYGSDPRRVHEILEQVAMGHAGVVQFERSRTLFEGFGESSLDFTLQFWAGSYEDGVRLKSEVALAVHDALKAANIEIPFPQRDIRILSMPRPEG